MGSGTYDSAFTQPERAASQRELDILRHRVEQMDSQGTRGVGILQLQVTEIVADLTQMRADTRAWQNEHERQHEQERRERIVGRRWLVGTGIAGLASMATVISMLIELLSHVH